MLYMFTLSHTSYSRGCGKAATEAQKRAAAPLLRGNWDSLQSSRELENIFVIGITFLVRLNG